MGGDGCHSPFTPTPLQVFLKGEYAGLLRASLALSFTVKSLYHSYYPNVRDRPCSPLRTHTLSLAHALMPCAQNLCIIGLYSMALLEDSPSLRTALLHRLRSIALHTAVDHLTVRLPPVFARRGNDGGRFTAPPPVLRSRPSPTHSVAPCHSQVTFPVMYGAAAKHHGVALSPADADAVRGLVQGLVADFPDAPNWKHSINQTANPDYPHKTPTLSAIAVRAT